ncbi:V8-like Glu-specific endopeptidase [Aquimarina sp. MAR_2010_214]|uniref:trypsin-like serine peptidase n=1 Tax=Aquimarina sp. MAR_2010_214 TaxID=1250026 RepID=UPI000C7016BF|nr:trypsin-like peptidase domain-containing protein [Aquimarina sp. MAR_2010_214]PKV51901.1 V8-like Glu-specific endopeptidase [Aquimarina sp. MAR_2010_214]
MKTLLLLSLLIITPIVAQEVEVNELKTIENTELSPFNQICYQHIRRNKILWYGGWAESTGFFIDKNFVLTAAHNVHSQFLSRVKEIKIKIGRNGDSQIYPTIQIKGKDIISKYVKTSENYGFLKGYKKKVQWDFALIYIPDELLPEGYTWNEEFSLGNDETLVNETIELAGYPAAGQIGDTDYSYDGSKMIFQSGKIEPKGKWYKHDFITHGGNSGSPLWVTKNMKNIIVGIHTFGGSGTLIDDESLQLIKSWMLEIKSN